MRAVRKFFFLFIIQGGGEECSADRVPLSDIGPPRNHPGGERSRPLRNVFASGQQQQSFHFSTIGHFFGIGVVGWVEPVPSLFFFVPRLIGR